MYPDLAFFVRYEYSLSNILYGMNTSGLHVLGFTTLHHPWRQLMKNYKPFTLSLLMSLVLIIMQPISSYSQPSGDCPLQPGGACFTGYRVIYLCMCEGTGCIGGPPGNPYYVCVVQDCSQPSLACWSGGMQTGCAPWDVAPMMWCGCPPWLCWI
jgi:hypothetical protein